MRDFLDTRIGLDDLFGTSRVSLLVEMLAEARKSAERFACVERFLAAHLREHCAKPVACRAAALLRRHPHLRVRHLAAQLDVSQRHLLRSFEAMFGMSPKQFARIARIERVWSARCQGSSWADIAHTTRFTNQAHMINNFTKILGVPPTQLVRPTTASDPDDVVIGRADNRHAAFGLSVHRCIGSHLARLEITIALQEWLHAIPEFSPGPNATVTWYAGSPSGGA